MLCHKLDIFCIILESCSPLSSLAVGILCIFFPQRLHLKLIILHVFLGGFSGLGCRCSGFYMLDIIIFCRAFSGFNLHIVCIKFLREAFRKGYPGWVFFFFLISYFSASFSSVFMYHFFNCFLNLFGFSVLSSSGMML